MSTADFWADNSFRLEFFAARAAAWKSRSAWFRDALAGRGIISLHGELQEDPGLLSWLTPRDRAVIQALAEESGGVAKVPQRSRPRRSRAWWRRPRIHRMLILAVPFAKAVALLLLGLACTAVFIVRE